MFKRGFTLIELLIVVAIIAILAAIAVPNFLEAQVRAKNAKCVADMRTLVTALESYRIDNNKYSTDAGNGAGGGIYRPYAGGNRQAEPKANFTIGYELTTPISYISSAEMLIDPYKRGKLQMYGPNTALSGRQYYMYINVPLRREKAGPNTYRSVEEAAGHYALWAAGPDGWGNNTPDGGEFSEVNYIPRTIEYDPSNGTISNGDVYRSQKYSSGIGRHPLLPANY